MDKKRVTRRKFISAGASSVAAAALFGAYAESAGAQQAQGITLYVFRGETGIKGPDSKNHDTFIPNGFVVQAGQPVQLTAINYDEGPHTITSPELGLNIMINPGNAQGDDVLPVTTNASFTVPKTGVYRWYCATDCDGGGAHWAMSQGSDGPDQDGYMAGNIVAI